MTGLPQVTGLRQVTRLLASDALCRRAGIFLGTLPLGIKRSGTKRLKYNRQVPTFNKALEIHHARLARCKYKSIYNPVDSIKNYVRICVYYILVELNRCASALAGRRAAT